MRVPSYRLHKPTNQAVVTLSGKDHYLGQYDSPASREKYARLIAAWVEGGRRPIVRTPAGPTISEVALAYWEWAETYYRKRGVLTTYAKTVRRTLRELTRMYGSTPAANFGPRDLKALRSRWVAKGVTRGTANGYTSQVVTVFKW